MQNLKNVSLQYLDELLNKIYLYVNEYTWNVARLKVQYQTQCANSNTQSHTKRGRCWEVVVKMQLFTSIKVLIITFTNYHQFNIYFPYLSTKTSCVIGRILNWWTQLHTLTKVALTEKYSSFLNIRIIELTLKTIDTIWL